MNKWIEILLGLILLLIAIYIWGINWIGFGSAALIVLKGGIIWLGLMIGLILLILGISELRE